MVSGRAFRSRAHGIEVGSMGGAVKIGRVRVGRRCFAWRPVLGEGERCVPLEAWVCGASRRRMLATVRALSCSVHTRGGLCTGGLAQGSGLTRGDLLGEGRASPALAGMAR